MTKTPPKKAIALSSGGKDSILALHIAKEQGYDICNLLTMIPEDPESMLYHTKNVEYVEKIAESMNLDWIRAEASKDLEEEALQAVLKSVDADVLVTGGVASNYQKKRFDRAASEADMIHVAPLWGMSGGEVLSKIIEMNMNVIITSVAAYGLDIDWLGRYLDKNVISELLKAAERFRFNVVGEGGDYDTFVLDAPLYSKKLVLLRSFKRWYHDAGVLEIEEIGLEEKRG